MNLKIKRRALGLLVPVASVALLTQCKDALDTQPFGTLNTGTYYKSAKDFESATVGAYSTLQNYTYSPGGGIGLYYQSFLPDDDTRGGGTTDANNDFNWTATNGAISYIWQVSYRGVLRTNLILQQLEQTDQLTAAQKGRFEGEAKFLRAYFNFMLARYFGTPPVLTKVATSLEETRPANSQPGEIWDLMESDLTDAIRGLAGQKLEAGRASEWAARALLGIVRVYRAQWFKDPTKYTQAIQPLQEVVNGGFCGANQAQRCTLVNFENNFKYTTENNAESLFELQASFGTDINGWAATDENGGGASSGTGRPITTGACGFNGVNAPGCGDWGYGQVIVTPSLVKSFESYGTTTVTLPASGSGTASQVDVTIRDPRAYFTFYSTGEQYARGCGSNPAPYNFRWSCSGNTVNRLAQSNWSLTGYTPAKYIRPFENFSGGNMLNQSVSNNNERLIRYADVLLFLAEAKTLAPSPDIPGAAALVNQVRARARAAYDRAYGSQSIDAALYAGVPRPANLLPDRPGSASATQMFQWIMQERRNEFALEVNHRYDDLVRWHRAGLINIKNLDFEGDDIAKTNWSERNLLRPIPQGERDLDPNLAQNPGY